MLGCRSLATESHLLALMWTNFCGLILNSHYLLQNNADDIIVVHCTHGFNRTGFLICAYMFQEEGSMLEIAAQSFAQARPAGIYKDDYLRDLVAMFQTDEELPCPGRPLWEDEDRPPSDFLSWKGESFTQNGHAAPSSSSTNNVAINQSSSSDKG
jgi:hypothetical protein